MSQPPPEATPPREDTEIGYATSATLDAPNGAAVVTLVGGILSLFAFPFITPIVFIIGIVALVRANHLHPINARRGITLAGMSCAVVSLLVFAPMMLHILSPTRSRGPHPLSYCMSNLRGLGQGLKVYANDNFDWYPTPPFAESDATDNRTNVSFIGNMGYEMTLPTEKIPDGLTNTHPSRALFMLVIDTTCSPSQFICPSSGDVDDDLYRPNGVPYQPGLDRFDFRGYPHISYGYQLPFGSHGRPGEMLDSRMVLMADKGRYFDAGKPIPAEHRTPDVPIGIPGRKVSLTGATSAQATLNLPDSAWKQLNSRNHQGEGQNMLFGDGHAEFKKRPIVGVDHDNIYTMQSGFTPMDIILGRQPADFRGPLTNTDSVIVP